MLELAVLGLLKERTMHGYQLSRQLTDTLGGFWRVSYGSLYPSLRRLERDGAVEKVFDPEEVGRRKNVYRITQKGEELFLELLEEAGHETGEENRFRVRLAFFKYLAPETRIRLLERRRAYLEERLVHDQDLVARHHRSAGHVHARADTARSGLDRAGHRLARRPDPGGASAHHEHPGGNEAT